MSKIELIEALDQVVHHLIFVDLKNKKSTLRLNRALPLRDKRLIKIKELAMEGIAEN